MVMLGANQGVQRCPLGVGAAELLACSTLWALRGRRGRPHAQGETLFLAVADDGWIARWTSSSCALFPFLLFLLSALLFLSRLPRELADGSPKLRFIPAWPE
jgi:hypothetical protein